MMTSNNPCQYHNFFGPNGIGIANRQFHGQQLYYESPVGTSIMKPSFSVSPDDRPLNSYLDHSPGDLLGYMSGSTDIENDFGDDMGLASLLELPDSEFLNRSYPNLLEEDFGSYVQTLTSVEERILPITHKEVETPPTPTLRPESTDTPKRSSQDRRKKPAKRPRRPRPRNRGNRSIHLWEFLKEMLNNSEENKSYIKWISKREGIFQLVNSSGVAKLWGQRKNRKNMTYEKMSRALRYYYEKDILERVPNARLIYKFGGKTKLNASENVDDSMSDSSEN